MEKNTSSHRQYRSLEWKFTIVLVCVIITVLVFAFCFIFQNTTAITDTSLELIHNQLSSVSQQANRLFTNYYRMCYMVSVNTSLQQYAAYSDFTSQDDRLKTGHQLQKDLLSIVNIYGENINTLAVYFPSNGSVITMARHLQSDSAYLFFRDYPEVSPEELAFLPLDSSGDVHFSIINGHNWCVRKVITQSGELAYILMEYSLSDAIAQLTSNTDGLIVLLGNDTQCLFSNGDPLEDSQYMDILSSARAQGRFRFGDGYYAMAENTRFKDISIIVGLPSSQITTVRTLLIVVIIASALLALGSLAILITNLKKKIFIPLEDLVFSHRNGQQDTASAIRAVVDDFTRIESNKKALLKERDHLIPIALGRSMDYLKNADWEDERTKIRAQSCLRMANISHEEGFAIFAVSLVNDQDHIFDLMDINSGKRMGAAHYFLDNVLKDLLYNLYPGILATVGTNTFVSVVSYPIQDDTAPVTEACHKLVSFFEENFSILLQITDVYQGVGSESFFSAVNNALQEVSFMAFWGMPSDSDDTESTDSRSLHSCSNAIRKLINNLNTQNFHAVSKELDTILGSTISINEKDIRTTKYQMFTLTSFIITAIEEYVNGDRAFIEAKGFEARLYDAKSINDYRAELAVILQEVAQHKDVSDKTTFISGRMENIRQYLFDHFRESSLNVASVAQEFDMNVSYLSRNFKASYNVNMLEYIQRLRVEEAKKLLRTHPVQEVAREVGFWDPQGLTRSFKKYEGIAPGDYKRLLEKEKEWH